MEQKIGEYELIKKIGEGAFGEVYYVFDTGLQRDCAMKILKDEHTKNPEYVSRFIRECQRLASLSHPNVCPIYEASRDASRPYYVTKLFDKNLEQLMDDGLCEKDIKSISDDILSGLQYIHKSGYLHLDIKPSNVMIDGKKALIADFGLAKLKCRGKTTRSVGFSGTLEYAAPEVREGKEPDVRSDIYSFGVVLHQMLTGRLPYAYEDAAKEKALSDDLENIFSKSLNPDPEKRYHSAEEMQKDIDSVLGRSRIVHFMKYHLGKLVKSITVGTLITFAVGYGIKREIRKNVFAAETSNVMSDSQAVASKYQAEVSTSPAKARKSKASQSTPCSVAGIYPNVELGDYLTDDGEKVSVCKDKEIVAFKVDANEKNRNPDIDEVDLFIKGTKEQLYLVEFMKQGNGESLYTMSAVSPKVIIKPLGKKVILNSSIPAFEIVYKNFEDIAGIGKVLAERIDRTVLVK